MTREVIQPDRMIQTLRERDWNSISLGAQVFAHICPWCAAMVPVGNTKDGISFREGHIQHHEWEIEGRK